jgi:RecA-family ATPase
MQSVDWVKIAPEVAKQLLGEPKSISSTEMRWNTHGSMVLNLEQGTFYDFEEGIGGGIIDLIKHLNQDVNTILKQFGYDQALPNDSLLINVSKTPPIVADKGNARSFTRVQTKELYKQAIVHLQYTNDFMVMRFPDGHFIRQKYAPFSRNSDGTWSMKRPEGKLPIYYTNNEIEKPIIICEGEKALKGAEYIVQGKFDVCTWHGGVNSWEKADWTPIYGRKVWIWPDNDDAGKKCALDIHSFLKEHKCKVSVIRPPFEFADKDDLYDAYENSFFANADELEEYAKDNQEYIPNDDVEFADYDEMEMNDTPPEWVIDKVIEKGSVASLYAEPKAGKSFVGISMMLSIATGKDWYDYTVNKPSGVLYLCGEGEKSIFKRILAWEKNFLGEYGKLRDAKFRVSKRPVRILDDENYEKLLRKAHEVKRELGSLGLIVIDTLQRNFGSGDENSTSDMNLFIQRVDRLKFETGACVMLVHHTGHAGNKSNGMRRGRGSSVLPASLDSEFYIERTDKDTQSGMLALEDKVMYVKMSQTLNKEDMNIPPINFRMDTITDLGKKKDKKSAILVKIDESEVPITINPVKPSPQEKPVLEALKKLPLEDNKENPQDCMYMPGTLEGKVQHNGKNLTSDQIAECLKGLKSKNLLKHTPNVGYQHKDYGEMMSKFRDKEDEKQ